MLHNCIYDIITPILSVTCGMYFSVNMLNCKVRVIQSMLDFSIYLFIYLQTKERLGDEPLKNWRPTLVSAGVALAPDTFLMVLDADSTPKGIIVCMCLAFDVLVLEYLWVVLDTAVNKHSCLCLQMRMWGPTHIAIGISFFPHSHYISPHFGKWILFTDSNTDID